MGYTTRSYFPLTVTDLLVASSRRTPPLWNSGHGERLRPFTIPGYGYTVFQTAWQQQNLQFTTEHTPSGRRYLNNRVRRSLED